MANTYKLPTETVLLPSKGLLYPEDSPLAKGEIEMKYMTAKEEDILTNSNYIQSGIVIDKLLESLIVTEGVVYDDLLVGDKNAVLVAARILSYGKDYQVNYRGQEHTVDLSELDHKQIDFDILKERKNNFNFSLPTSKAEVTFKLLTHGDEKEIDKEIDGLKKINKDSGAEVTTRLKKIITSVNGSTETKDIREFVDNYLLAKDARELRNYLSTIMPDVEMLFYPNGREGGGVNVPIGLDFFWPDTGI